MFSLFITWRISKYWYHGGTEMGIMVLLCHAFLIFLRFLLTSDVCALYCYCHVYCYVHVLSQCDPCLVYFSIIKSHCLSPCVKISRGDVKQHAINFQTCKRVSDITIKCISNVKNLSVCYISYI